LSADPGSDSVRFIPRGQDPLAWLARTLVETHAGGLPDLSDVTVILPAPHAAARLRKALLEQAARAGREALLGPHCHTLRSWCLSRYPPALPVAGDHLRQLMLVEALNEHASLFHTHNPWTIATVLGELFGQLALYGFETPGELDAFTRDLASAYGAGAGNRVLGAEARIVHTLWHAWLAQLDGERRIDAETAYVSGLQRDAGAPEDGGGFLYMAGHDDLSPLEQAWLEQRLQKGTAAVLLQAPVGRFEPGAAGQAPGGPAPAPADDLLRMLDAAYAPGGVCLAERARAFAGQCPRSPARGHLALYPAPGQEQEACAVDIAVRRWLLAGRETVGIVTANRMLARRIRALLERAGIEVADTGGWALSTTSAASAVERWLQCIEEDFPHGALLDLLKSPFFCDADERAAHLERVYRLERDIIRHENIGAGLSRYRRYVLLRGERLPNRMSESLVALLDGLRAAARHLLPFLGGGQYHPEQFLQALVQSLRELGVHAQLAADPAGQCLLEEIGGLRQSMPPGRFGMDWAGFRAWLAHTLEHAYFRLPVPATGVTLLGLEDTALSHFDAVVLAGADAEHLPHAPSHALVFNDAVRRELGLPTLAGERQRQFACFSRLLESAPEVLVTFRTEQDGEPVQASPWVALLEQFHRLAWGEDLEDAGLAALAGDPRTRIVDDGAPLPAPAFMPAPAMPAEMVPETWSASAYQDLMNCPYLFFASRCLRLAPTDEVRLALEKHDYGARVHRCLQAFHAGVPGLPEPFGARITEDDRQQAVECLTRISEAVFARDIEDSFEHRGWLQQWTQRIPDVIDWEMERQRSWSVQAAEDAANIPPTDSLPGLKGRIDRVETGGAGAAIIDYKTGKLPGRAAIESGEAVQLPFYARLAGVPVAQVGYLNLGDRNAKIEQVYEGPLLDEIVERDGQRLAELTAGIRAGANFPAWGDDEACRYCRMEGVCRRSLWAETDPDTRRD